MHLLHLDLKDIVITVSNIGIEHMNVDHRQNPTRQIRGRILHLTMHVPNATSLDIKEIILDLKYIQIIRQRIKEKIK